MNGKQLVENGLETREEFLAVCGQLKLVVNNSKTSSSGNEFNPVQCRQDLID